MIKIDRTAYWCELFHYQLILEFARKRNMFVQLITVTNVGY